MQAQYAAVQDFVASPLSASSAPISAGAGLEPLIEHFKVAPISSGGDPLGTDRKLQAASDRKETRRLRHQRWHTAAAWLPNERIPDCRQYASFSRLAEGQAPAVVADAEGARWAGLCRCRSIWGCPLCNGYETELRRKALQGAVDEWRGRGRGFLMVTYTLPHGAGDRLAQLLDKFLAGQVAMCGRRAYKQLRAAAGVEHEVKALEVTVGPRSGWHPHRHTLMFTDREVAAADMEALAQDLEEELALQWTIVAAELGLAGDQAAVAHMLERSVKVAVGFRNAEEYVAKFGHEERWSLAAELTKAAVKAGRSKSGQRFTPMQLLDAAHDPECKTAPAQLQAWFVEYYAAFKGRSQLHWSKGAQAAIGYVEPELGSDEDAEHTVLETTWPEWVGVRRELAQLRVLETVEERGQAAALQLLDELAVKHADPDLVYRDWRGRLVYRDDGRRGDAHVPAWVLSPGDDELAAETADWFLQAFGAVPSWAVDLLDRPLAGAGYGPGLSDPF